MADILCDVTQLPKVQKWVTLQPNRNYNTYKSCNVNHRLDMKSIADEISNELLGPSLTLKEFNQKAGRFPERIRSSSGRSISSNRLRNLISTSRRAHKSNIRVSSIDSRPRSVRFEATDVIAAPPQLTSRPLRPPLSELPTSASKDTRFGNRRPRIAAKQSNPRRAQRFKSPASPGIFQPQQTAVTSFIEQQRTRNENNFLLHDTSSDSVLFNRLNNRARFVPSNNCLFGFCR